MPDVDRDMCRKAAAECIELARATIDPAKKELLLTRALEWLKLAYSKNEAEFERLVSELNEAQMTPVRRASMQQPQQQLCRQGFHMAQETFLSAQLRESAPYLNDAGWHQTAVLLVAAADEIENLRGQLAVVETEADNSNNPARPYAMRRVRPARRM